jgi:hypothetical protein
VINTPQRANFLWAWLIFDNYRAGRKVSIQKLDFDIEAIISVTGRSRTLARQPTPGVILVVASEFS